VLLALLICMVSATSVLAQPPTPFVIPGWVNDSSGDPVNNPAVAITNTEESFVVETVTDSNYYRVITISYNVSANDVLSFSVNGETVTTHTVTQDDMDAGGFEQNLTVEGTSGICGDVTCDGQVDIGDVILLANYVGYYPGMLQYELNSSQQWAGDVTGDCMIDIGDVILLANHVGYYPGMPQYVLSCNCSCSW